MEYKQRHVLKCQKENKYCMLGELNEQNVKEQLKNYLTHAFSLKMRQKADLASLQIWAQSLKSL